MYPLPLFSAVISSFQDSFFSLLISLREPGLYSFVHLSMPSFINLPSIYTTIPSLFLIFHLPSFHPFFLILLSVPSSMFFSLFPPPLPSSLHLAPSLHRQSASPAPSQSDSFRGLMLWKMTVNRHFSRHPHRFGAACCLQPCCLATPQTASFGEARAPVCCAAIETRAS